MIERRLLRSARLLLAAVLLAGALGHGGLALGQSSRPASQPAAAGPVGPEAVRAQVTLIFEVDEHHLKVQESWQMQNVGPGPVPASALVFPLGSRVRRLQLDEDTEGFSANDAGSIVRATRDLRPGPGGFAGSYLLDFDGAAAVLERTFPVPVGGGRIILEDIPGLTVDGSTAFESRARDLNGLTFRIFDFGGLEAGHRFRVRISGLPSRSALPRQVALALSALAFLWMLAAVLRKPSGTLTPVLGALSAEARREQLLRALELLEEDRRAGRIEGKKHERRQKALMADLAAVLREIELARDARPRGGAPPRPA